MLPYRIMERMRQMLHENHNLESRLYLGPRKLCHFQAVCMKCGMVYDIPATLRVCLERHINHTDFSPYFKTGLGESALINIGMHTPVRKGINGRLTAMRAYDTRHECDDVTGELAPLLFVYEDWSNLVRSSILFGPFIRSIVDRNVWFDDKSNDGYEVWEITFYEDKVPQSICDLIKTLYFRMPTPNDKTPNLMTLDQNFIGKLKSSDDSNILIDDSNGSEVYYRPAAHLSNCGKSIIFRPLPGTDTTWDFADALSQHMTECFENRSRDWVPPYPEYNVSLYEEAINAGD